MAGLLKIPKKKGLTPKSMTPLPAVDTPMSTTYRAEERPRMTPGQRKKEYEALPKDPHGRLVRQRSDSDKILHMITSTAFEQQRFMRHLNICLQGWNGYSKYGVTNDDIYWFTRDNKVHLSLHYGGSQTNEGAFHIKYVYAQNTVNQNTINFRIDVSDTLQENLVVNEKIFNGRHIKMDKTNSKRIEGSEYTYCQDILNSICQCLDDYITQFISTRGGRHKSRRRTSQTYIRKKHKKTKNKTRKKYL
jgi:hypothetical protein